MKIFIKDHYRKLAITYVLMGSISAGFIADANSNSELVILDYRFTFLTDIFENNISVVQKELMSNKTLNYTTYYGVFSGCMNMSSDTLVSRCVPVILRYMKHCISIIINKIQIVMNYTLLFSDYFKSSASLVAQALLRVKNQLSGMALPNRDEWVLLLAGLGLIFVKIVNNNKNSQSLYLSSFENYK